MKADLDELFNFVRLTHEIRRVRRAILLEGNKKENDAEHCYQLALVAWFLIEKDKLKLDKYRSIGMAMVHDIVEVYAGDTIAFAPPREREAHAKREKEAAKRLKKEWPSFKSLHELINEYEERQTPESKFVFALDKILPTINNYIFGGKVWRQLGISFDQHESIKKGKADISPELLSYQREISKMLQKQPELFG